MCALTHSSLACWGNNNDGSVGNGNTDSPAGVAKVRISVPELSCGGIGALATNLDEYSSVLVSPPINMQFTAIEAFPTNASNVPLCAWQ
jgi:hypothetical protein